MRKIKILYIRDLIVYKVHLGTHMKRVNSKMRPFILGSRKGYAIFNILKTYLYLLRTKLLLSKIIINGSISNVLFISTDKLIAPLIEQISSYCNSSYINDVCKGGILTNFKFVSKKKKKKNFVESKNEVFNLNEFNRKSSDTNQFTSIKYMNKLNRLKKEKKKIFNFKLPQIKRKIILNKLYKISDSEKIQNKIYNNYQHQNQISDKNKSRNLNYEDQLQSIEKKKKVTIKKISNSELPKIKRKIVLKKFYKISDPNQILNKISNSTKSKDQMEHLTETREFLERLDSYNQPSKKLLDDNKIQKNLSPNEINPQISNDLKTQNQISGDNQTQNQTFDIDKSNDVQSKNPYIFKIIGKKVYKISQSKPIKTKISNVNKIKKSSDSDHETKNKILDDNQNQNTILNDKKPNNSKNKNNSKLQKIKKKIEKIYGPTLTKKKKTISNKNKTKNDQYVSLLNPPLKKKRELLRKPKKKINTIKPNPNELNKNVEPEKSSLKKINQKKEISPEKKIQLKRISSSNLAKVFIKDIYKVYSLEPTKTKIFDFNNKTEIKQFDMNKIENKIEYSNSIKKKISNDNQTQKKILSVNQTKNKLSNDNKNKKKTSKYNNLKTISSSHKLNNIEKKNNSKPVKIKKKIEKIPSSTLTKKESSKVSKTKKISKHNKNSEKISKVNKPKSLQNINQSSLKQEKKISRPTENKIMKRDLYSFLDTDIQHFYHPNIVPITMKKYQKQLKRKNEQKKIFNQKKKINCQFEEKKYEYIKTGLVDFPQIVIIVGQQKEMKIIKECQKLNILTISVVDSDGDPSLTDLFIPGNDDNRSSIEYMLKQLAEGIEIGHVIRDFDEKYSLKKIDKKLKENKENQKIEKKPIFSKKTKTFA